MKYGAGALSDSELIAILLRTGVTGESVLNMSSRLLSSFGGLGGLSRANFTEMSSLKGVSEAKVCQIKAALELGRRLGSLHPEERAIIHGPEDVKNLLGVEMGLLEQEHLKVLLLDTKNHVTAIREIYIGNVKASIVRPAEVLRPAVRENSNAIIVVHNHPSGDPTPSSEDVSITRQIRESGDLLGIELLDHVILAGRRHVSLKDRSLGF